MKKIFVFIVLALFLLSACTTGQPPVTQQSTEIVYATPDAGKATPAVGFAVIRKAEGLQTFLLRSSPDPKSLLSGQVAPGAVGTLLGINQTGDWALLEFKDQSQSGWAPIESLDLTIAQ
jgi:hypothetical protein